ncbi:transposase, MuDR, MULE transposase domain protein [Tanacetum coccineum]
MNSPPNYGLQSYNQNSITQNRVSSQNPADNLVRIIPGLAGEIPIGCSDDIKSFIKSGKLEKVVVIKSCTPNALGDLTMILKDPSGTISGTIHHKIINEGYNSGRVTDVGGGGMLDQEELMKLLEEEERVEQEWQSNVIHSDEHVRIYQKSQENSQKQASTDTRTEECTKAESKAKEKSILKTAKKDIISKKPELNDDMYNWIIAKYGTTNENWTDSQFESVADDIYITFFEKSDPPKDIEDIVKPEVGYVAKTTNLEANQEVIVIDLSSSEPECSSTSELECSSTSKLELLAVLLLK